jgi:hypothetical protein
MRDYLAVAGTLFDDTKGSSANAMYINLSWLWFQPEEVNLILKPVELISATVVVTSASVLLGNNILSTSLLGLLLLSIMFQLLPALPTLFNIISPGLNPV